MLVKRSLLTILYIRNIPVAYPFWYHITHYCNIIMGTMASLITSLTSVYSAVYSRRWSKKTSKLRVTGLWAGNSPETGEFPAQMASNPENVSIWCRHHDLYKDSLFKLTSMKLCITGLLCWGPLITGGGFRKQRVNNGEIMPTPDANHVYRSLPI